MKTRFNDWFFAYKFLAMALLVILLGASILGFWGYRVLSRQLDSRINNEGESSYNDFSASISREVGGSENLSADIQNELEAGLGGDGDLILVEITDKPGRVIASTREKDIGQKTILLGAHRRALKTEKTSSRLIVYKNNVEHGKQVASYGLFDDRHKALEFTGPLYNNRNQLIGVIHIFVAADSLYVGMIRAMQSFAEYILIIGFLSLVPSVLLIVYRIDRPLRSLENTATEIARGSLSSRAKVTSNDEIGRLAEAFNRMTDSLVSTQFQAETDGLTSLYNYRHFQQYLAAQIAFADRYKRSFTLAIADLDHFKAVNDKYGHTTGDEVLVKVAAYLTAETRETDYIARYGGEEFAIIMPEINGIDAATAMDRLRAGFQKAVFVEDGGNRRPVSVSIGLADFPNIATDSDSLISAADSALLFAKRRGRNQVAYLGQLPSTRLNEEDIESLFNRLRRAQQETIEALAAAADARMGYEPGHADEIGKTASMLAETLDLGVEGNTSLMAAAKIRDIGALGIAPDLYKKKGVLTASERQAIRKSPIYSERILKASTELANLVPIVIFHHEKWDGTGYPKGLKGTEIPFGARILAITEAYYAMISKRPYRKALTPDEALGEIRKGAGTQFDPTLVEEFVTMMSRKKAA